MFKLNKIFKGIFIILAIILASVSSAQEDAATSSEEIREASIVAQVGVYNTRVIQRDSEFLVTFDLENSGDDVYDINYKIKLYLQGSDGKPVSLIDQKINENSFGLSSGEKQTKEFVYERPFSLDGTYQFWVELETQDGLPLATGFARNIEIEGTNSFVLLGDGLCSLSVGGENFALLQGVDVSSDEDLLIACDSTNLSDKDMQNLNVRLTTFTRSTAGKDLGAETIGTVSFSPSEKKEVFLKLPTKTVPQGYGAVLELEDQNGNLVSNKVELHYVMRGASASIHTVSKMEKENGVIVDVNYAIGSDDFIGSRKGPTDMTGSKIEARLGSVSGACSSKSEEIDLFDVVSSFDLGADESCAADVIYVDIYDKNGATLASKKVSLDKPFVPVKKGFDITDPENLQKIVMFGLPVVVLLIILVLIFGRRNSKVMVLAVLMMPFAQLAVPQNVAEAATIHIPYVCQVGNTRIQTDPPASSMGCVLHSSFNRWMFPYDNGTVPAVADEAYTAVNLNKNTCYMPGEEIDVTATGWIKAKCGNGAPGWVDVTIDGDRQRLVSYTPPNGGVTYTTEDFTPGYGTFTAPGQPGAHTASVVLVNTHGGTMSRRASIPFTVCNVDVNATCGTANGGNYQSAPSTNLCGLGDGLQGSVTRNPDGSKSWSWTCGGSGNGSDAVCSTNSCTANYGDTCNSQANACGATNSGVYNCSGQCVNSLAGNIPVSTPNVRDTNPTYGDTKTSSANACGARSTTRGTCTSPAPNPNPPSTASCPVGPVCVTDNDPNTTTPASLPTPSDGVVRPVAVDEEGNTTPLGEPFTLEGNPTTYKVGDKCFVSNPSCSDQAPNESYVTCDGTCAVGQPVCGGKECISRGNVQGKTNRIFIEDSAQCNVTVPSDSVCEIPSFGFRTKNGLYTVDPGTEKTLVWDTVLNATYCDVKRADGDVLAEINNFIRDTTRPQPGHSWTNILPSGEVETGPINQTTEYIMTCINVDSPEVTERLRITLTPNVIEN